VSITGYSTGGWQTADALARSGMVKRALIIAALITGTVAYAAAVITTQGSPYFVLPFVAALAGVALMVWPRLGLYTLFGAALLLEEWGIAGLEPITGQLHFFQNVSGYSPIPIRLSAADLLALFTLVAWLLRRVVRANEPGRLGSLGWPILAYGAFFVIGLLVGIARGGDWNMSAALAELRGPVYLCVMYLLTVNLVRDRRHVAILVRLLVVLIAVKALQGVFNYVEMTNGPIWLEAVTAHEDVVFFDLLLAMAVGAFVLGLRSRLATALYAVTPIVVVTELITQRRVAFIAMAAALVVLAVLLSSARPRRTLVLFGSAFVCFLVYAVLAWDQQGLLAQPIRALKGAIDPTSLNARDLSSNWWRELESTNIAYTLRQLPLTGVGLGQQYLFLREPPELSNFVYWRYMTHDAVLWVWLKTGIAGFVAFWALVVQSAIVGASLFRRLPSTDLKMLALLPVLLITIQVVFSSVDLGLTYTRTMITLGVMLGLTAYLKDQLIPNAAVAA
jgi:hypothetical protein